MIAVILAGGRGSRLWPLSTDSCPKQFLEIVDGESLLKKTYFRAKSMADEVLIVTEISLAGMVEEELPDMPSEKILTEPARRGTASCVLMALDYLVRNGYENENVVFMHSDNLFENDDLLKECLLEVIDVANGNTTVGLIGVVPTYPATKYGYIEKGNSIKRKCSLVKQFTEKPSYQVASGFLKTSRYLWNIGCSAGKVSDYIKNIKIFSELLRNELAALESFESFMEYNYAKRYLSFKDVSIDVGLFEKMNNLIVTEAEFDWADVGSYEILHGLLDKDDRRNVVEGSGVVVAEDVEGAIIINDEQKPVAVIGVSNIAVISTSSGVLVADIRSADRIGDIIKMKGI